MIAIITHIKTDFRATKTMWYNMRFCIKTNIWCRFSTPNTFSSMNVSIFHYSLSIFNSFSSINSLSVKKQFPVLCTRNSILPTPQPQKGISLAIEYRYSPANSIPFFFRLCSKVICLLARIMQTGLFVFHFLHCICKCNVHCLIMVIIILH